MSFHPTLCSYVAGGATSNGVSSEWSAKIAAALPLHDTAAAPTGSFPAIFSRALALGVVSRRRLYHEAVLFLQQRKKVRGKRGGGRQKRS